MSFPPPACPGRVRPMKATRWGAALAGVLVLFLFTAAPAEARTRPPRRRVPGNPVIPGIPDGGGGGGGGGRGGRIPGEPGVGGGVGGAGPSITSITPSQVVQGGS